MEIASDSIRSPDTIQILTWNVKQGMMLDQLKAFDGAGPPYTKSTKNDVADDDDAKIGIVTDDMEADSFKEHLVLDSERCDTYGEFWDEVDTIATARSRICSALHL